jgi:NAD(P)-dependent dehydrogenase (short-subunit alcohol dehydrogenase family)
MQAFLGKSVVVTGAASGIGRSTAKQFSANGAHLVLADIDADAVEKCAAEIRDAGGTALAVVCDVTSESSIQAMIDCAARTFGGLHVLVSNAGILMLKSAAQASAAQWAQCFATNTSAAALCARYAYEPMQRSGGGAIALVASISGCKAEPGFATYSASKAALLMLTRSMAVDYGPSNIRVNAVCPGPVETRGLRGIVEAADFDWNSWKIRVAGMQCLRSLIQPEDVAKTILFLCSDDARMITGASLVVDGGLLARSYDRM